MLKCLYFQIEEIIRILELPIKKCRKHFLNDYIEISESKWIFFFFFYYISINNFIISIATKILLQTIYILKWIKKFNLSLDNTALRLKSSLNNFVWFLYIFSAVGSENKFLFHSITSYFFTKQELMTVKVSTPVWIFLYSFIYNFFNKID